jgi:hypothetical protein
VIHPAAAPPIARPRNHGHKPEAGAARAVPVAVLREAITELELWAGAHEEAGEEFCLNRAEEIRQVVRKLKAVRRS